MRKENKKYYFTVEGETEQRYLKWLQRTINNEPLSRYTVIFDCPVQKNPLTRAKTLISLGKTEITHIFDYESNDDEHTKSFRTTLDRMKEAQSTEIRKQICYLLGYSNFSFELWMILHKIDCSSPLTNRRQHLALINRAYGEQFESLDTYKREDEFERVLQKITLRDVKNAIERAKTMMHKKCRKWIGFTGIQRISVLQRKSISFRLGIDCQNFKGLPLVVSFLSKHKNSGRSMLPSSLAVFASYSENAADSGGPTTWFFP